MKRHLCPPEIRHVPTNLAHESDGDRAHVSKLERGIAYVGLEVIGKFSKVLHVPPDPFRKPLVRKSAKKRA